LIEKARDVVFFSPGLTMASFMEEVAHCSVEAGGEEARQAVSVACGRRSQDRKADKDRLNAPEVGPPSYQACGVVNGTNWLAVCIASVMNERAALAIGRRDEARGHGAAENRDARDVAAVAHCQPAAGVRSNFE
jgi:hypothetical protein